MAYVRQTGPLNTGQRIEQGFAMLATLISRIHGGKAELSDFLPDRELKTEPAEAKPEDILRLLQRVKG